jgi:hypothetical protein
LIPTIPPRPRSARLLGHSDRALDERIYTDDWSPQPDDRQFLKRIYQELDDKPLQPGDPRYEPSYDHPGCEDPIRLLQNSIEFAHSESLNLFSGFRGSGKTTELFRLRQRLEQSGYLVLYSDALDYINPSAPIQISDLLITLAGAFSDALQEIRIDVSSEAYWTRLWNWLNKTEVTVKELGFKTEVGLDPVKAGADLKLELKTTPSFRQKLAQVLEGRIGELNAQVRSFFEDGFKAIRRQCGPDKEVVFLFDSLEQIRGSLSNEQKVTRSVELLFSNHLKLLAVPYLHFIYTVPPWLKFLLPGTNMVVLPCLRMWNKDAHRSACQPGIEALQSLVKRRFSPEGLDRFFGPDPFSRAKRLIELCGGHFRDLLLLLRETVLRADTLPVSDEAIDAAIVRSNFLPISLEDAQWLAQIESERATLLKSTEPAEISRLTRFLDTHIVLYLRNGEEWYDIHPLVREEVRTVAAAARA